MLVCESACGRAQKWWKRWEKRVREADPWTTEPARAVTRTCWSRLPPRTAMSTSMERKHSDTYTLNLQINQGKNWSTSSSLREIGKYSGRVYSRHSDLPTDCKDLSVCGPTLRVPRWPLASVPVCWGNNSPGGWATNFWVYLIVFLMWLTFNLRYL